MCPAGGLLFLLLHSLLLQISLSKDSISVNESVADGDLLVSTRQTFTLGFFSPGNSSNRYVGIWFTNVPVQTVVWVANRDRPISDSSGVLSVTSQGNLVIFANKQSVPIWSTNLTASSTGKSMAQLLDSGNLVVVQQDSKSLTWQSFDHPINHILSSAKFGVDHKTGLNQILTSWKSLDDPGTGEWNLRMEPQGSPESIVYKGEVPRWRTGPWDGGKYNGVPEMARNFIFTNDLVNNSDETVYTWGITDPSVISTMYLDEAGVLSRDLWNQQENRWITIFAVPKEPCDYYGHCGVFGICNPYNARVFECSCLPGFQPKSPDNWYLRDSTDGCVRNAGASVCGNGEGFIKIPNAKLPVTSMARVDMSLDSKACEKACLKDCSCMAYATANIKIGAGCIAWFGDLIDIRVFTAEGQDLYVRADAAELAKYRKSSQNFLARKGMVAVLVISLAVLFILVVSILYWRVKRKRNGSQLRGLFESNTIALLRFGDRRRDEFDENLPFIDVHDIIAATNGFSFANKLGEGGFGSVYKGQLASGQEIAVKRLSQTSRQGTEEFKNEVRLISKLQHKNLVRLYGCCVHREEKMLVYEFLPNRSLDFFIFDVTRRSTLDWSKRFEIIRGIARGLLYLHQDSRLKIIHRDLKASNVLLDAAMNPKISDFGMAKIVGDDQTAASTNRVLGTYGYMSPEYAMDGLYSIKSDVFSYGVLILEIITGRRNNGYVDEDPSKNLIGHVWEFWREGTVLDVVDSMLGQTYSTHEVLKCIQIGLLCLQENPVDRPTMSAVIFMLGNETAMSSPNKPAFVLKAKPSNSYSSTIRNASSINDVSISRIEPR